MKIRAAMVLGCLLFAVVLFMGDEYSRAEVKADIPGLKIGVVSIQAIFDKCERSSRYRQEAIAERSRVEAKLEKLAKEMEAARAGLKAYKAGSSEHLALMKDIFEKQASLQAEQEFYKQQMPLKEQKMIEELYKDILRVTGEVAEGKGLNLVFERSEPELPTSSSTELTMIISTHKLLYSGGCLDITEEVMARIDKEK